MSRQNHVRWMGVVGVALVVAVTVSTAGAAGRPRSALDEAERRDPTPGVETIVLRFVHIPAESFVDTLEQLARNPQLHEGLEQMPIAVNEPANAVVLMAPPEIAAVLARGADELDQPNEFLMHERERDAEELAWQVEMEERKRDFDRDQVEFELEMDRQRLELDRQEAAARLEMEAAKRRLAQPPAPRMAPQGRSLRMAPGRAVPPSQAARPPWALPGRGRRPEGEPPRPPQPGREGRKPVAPPRQPLALRAERPGHPPTPPEHEEAQRHRREYVERIEAEQRKFSEMLDQHQREAEQHLMELERKRQHLMEEHRRRLEAFGSRLNPEQREAHERALHEQMEAMEKAQHQIREAIENQHRHLKDRLEDLERQKHRAMEESPGPMPPRHEEARRREPDRPEPRRREGGRPGPEGEPPRLGPGPMDPGLGRLLTPDGREALGLSDEQVEQITNLVRRLRQHVEETREGIRDKLRRAGPEDREHLLRAIKEKMAGRWGEHRRNITERLAEILNPDQRERLKQWVREHGSAERPGLREQEPPTRPPEDRPRGRKGPHHPADETRAPTHRLM